MCEPTTLAVASLAVSGVGLFMQSQAAKQQAQSTNMANEYNAQISESNAQISRYQAQDALARGEENVTKIQEGVASTQSRQRVGYAASGVQVDVGSALEAIGDTAYKGEIDSNTARHNAQLEAWGYEVQESNYMSQAAMSRAQYQSPNGAFATTLLGGAGPLLGQASDYRYRFGPAKREG